jgi:hypothetical protein
MTPDMERRLTNLEEVYGLAAKVHFVWDDGNTNIKAEIARRVAEGASEDDRFVVIGWAAGREVPVTGSDR